MNTISFDRNGKDVMAYVDNTSICTVAKIEHLTSLYNIFTILRNDGAKLKLSECQFGRKEAENLGHKVSQIAFLPFDGHVQAIGELVKPASGEELMRFIILVNYFSELINQFLELARILYDVLKGTRFSKKRARRKKLIIHEWDARWRTR